MQVANHQTVRNPSNNKSNKKDIKNNNNNVKKMQGQIKDHHNYHRGPSDIMQQPKTIN